MEKFTNKKLQNLYLALIDLYGEENVGWQDIGEENELISFTIHLCNNNFTLEQENKKIEMTLWLNANEHACYGEYVDSKYLNFELNPDYSVWAIES